MKAEILKIAGVKNEKEFYKKFPTEEAFMKKHGKELKKAAPGISMPVNAPKLPTLQNTFASTPTPSFGSKIKTLGSNIGEGVKKGVAVPDLSTPSGLAGMIGGIGAGINTINQTDKNIAELQKYGKVSDVVLAAAGTRPERVKNKYIRPEDNLVQNVNPLGTGTNYLAAKNGAEIQNTYAPDVMYSDLGYEPLNDSNKKQYKKGGKLKKAAVGEVISAANSLADVSRASGQIGGTLAGQWSGTGGETGGYTQALGGFGLIGGLIGGFLDAPQIKKKQQAQSYLDKNTGLLSGMNQFDNFAQQNSAVMENGGWVSHDWQPQVIASFGEHSMKDLLKPDPMMDTLRAGGHLKEYTPPTERAMSTERAENGTSMAMGGDLRTIWGGKAEPISYNPFLPNGGETVMFRGQSHDETNSDGQSGIGVQYGDGGSMMSNAEYGVTDRGADVEVERNEPATIMKSGDGKDNLVVFGNMEIPEYGANEIGDKKAKGMKFKRYIADLSKQEAKNNKYMDKSLDLLNSVTTNDPFEQLSFNSGKAMLVGSKMNLKNIADKKMNAAAVQDAILETAEEQGMDSAKLAKQSIAKFGGKFTSSPMAKDGISKLPTSSSYKFDIRNFLPQAAVKPMEIVNPPALPSYYKWDKEIGDYAPESNEVRPASTASKFIDPRNAGWSGTDDYQQQAQEKEKKSGFPYDTLIQAGLTAIDPFIRPKYNDSVSPEQLAPEFLGSALNQLQPVPVQLYKPILTQATSISLQDQLNEITAQTRDAMRMAQGDPAMLTRIASDAYNAKTKVIGEQTRMNQAEKQRVAEQNASVLNDAQMKNLALLDQQMVRQYEGASKTKTQSIEIAKSIADKIAKKKSENLMANVYQNMYPDYNFTGSGAAYKNLRTMAAFGPGMGRGSAQSRFGGANIDTSKMLPTNYDDYGNPTHFKIVGAKNTDKDIISKNGAIVRAIKNL